MLQKTNKTIGSKIMYLRKENNLSRYELATRLGISESIISKYERNINLPSIEAALKICQLFKIT
ncbi:MAG: helix-turn-helix transcriptional regulator, partial [Bacteroidetes bacterium]|nr:helix-turn-helix transcriptional regulator [Bacteroidota bacterium]